MSHKILIVEDEIILAMHLKRKLERMDYQVLDFVITGEEALERVKTQKPDVVFMDLSLKGEMSGLDAAEIILSQYDIPVIFLTAHSDADTFRQMSEISPIEPLIKPVNEKKLTELLEKAVA